MTIGTVNHEARRGKDASETLACYAQGPKGDRCLTLDEGRVPSADAAAPGGGQAATVRRMGWVGPGMPVGRSRAAQAPTQAPGPQAEGPDRARGTTPRAAENRPRARHCCTKDTAS
ncbi:hypothetical protein [Ponticoccus litoralis]|uniref:Uncharacterized protein n=1 Tax=Ponticoccus litoralis TaxID=422297 RepID=A0AAW9SS51_9RHOB